ncbi:DUF3102 domain-containing protein [Bradyrhizobium sp. Ash2021]|uniref:DUF3102 domain-containing protein n=1 Tax=Bradyrhizobium sp. Ash2021 TaxID=2954771 RepID=UPI002816640C|nr:DUF3102 domain-containing protein [Bradyrhizobium sp. Ash2021]WMT75429.1 DUF3102 domain-containing protein [Bradyrhizobium sp. Ash2021]
MTLPNRTLADVTDELRVAIKRETGNILTIGALLAEAKTHVKHGVWLSWLKVEFSMSDRSAQKYIKAADFAAKNELGSDLNLSPSALYLLSEDSYWGEGRCRREATEAVIKAAKEKRLGSDEAKEIIEKAMEELVANEAEPQISAASSVPELAKPRSRVNPRDDTEFNFTRLVLELDRITNKKPPDRFAKTYVQASILDQLGKLLTEIADLKKSRASWPIPPASDGTIPSEQRAEGTKPKQTDRKEADVEG